MSEFVKKIQALHAEAMQFAASEPLDRREPSLRPPFYAPGVTAEMIKKGGLHYHRQNAFRLRNAAAKSRAEKNVHGNAAILEADARVHEEAAKKIEGGKKKHGETFSADEHNLVRYKKVGFSGQGIQGEKTQLGIIHRVHGMWHEIPKDPETGKSTGAIKQYMDVTVKQPKNGNFPPGDFSAKPAGEFAVRRIPSAHTHAVMLTDAGSSMRNATIGGGSIVKSFPSEQEAKSHAAALQHTEDKKPVFRDGKYRVVALDDPKATPQGRSHREIHQLKASNPHFGGGMFSAAPAGDFAVQTPNDSHYRIANAYIDDRKAGIGHKEAWAKHAGKPGADTAKNMLNQRIGRMKQDGQKWADVKEFSAHGTPRAKRIIGIKAK